MDSVVEERIRTEELRLWHYCLDQHSRTLSRLYRSPLSACIDTISSESYTSLAISLRKTDCFFSRNFRSAVSNFKSNASDPTTLISYITVYSKPLSSLAKRAKVGLAELTCEDLAFFSLCDVLVAKLVKRTE